MKTFIENTIKNFVNTSDENTQKNKNNDRAFDSPLVGYARGDDPIFEQYKENVAPFHMTPLEIFSKVFNDSIVKAEKLTVISWILPVTNKTKSENSKENFYPSESWARTRIFGEEFNVKVHKYLVEVLTSKGYRAVAPGLTSSFSIKPSPKYGLASTWSERHMAYAAGLGTFGLCDGLITPVGKAMRAGSVVAEIQMEPTPRPYTDHHEYCLFFTRHICGKCIPKCPVGAITKNGKDKTICNKHLFPVTSDYVISNYGFKGYGCGHCQTGVPCESKIPTEEDLT
jgi:epoxyqueuosine reductase